MDEQRIADQAEQREATRALGVSGRRKRVDATEVALTGAEPEAQALPVISSRDLNTSDGDELFILGETSWFSETARLSW